MKYLFLDIDGALNSTRTAIAFANIKDYGTGSLAFSTDSRYPTEFSKEYFRLDPVAIELLRRVIEDTGAKIVISSTWRLGSCIEHFNKMFECYGWDTTKIIIGMTPHLGKIRGYDVAAWLEENIGDFGDFLESYVIVDDGSDFLPHQKEYLVQTNPHIGFSHVTYEECVKKLGAISSTH